jgi:microcin C transport system ATP-binding protein
MTSLNPLHMVEKQIGEVLRVHGQGMRRDQCTERSIQLLRKAGHSGLPSKRLKCLSNQLSGGRAAPSVVMIAMALANNPDAADCRRATTALDVHDPGADFLSF